MSNKRICRACLLETKEMRSLFAAGKIMGKTLNLAQVLSACANLKIEKNDGFPQEICLQCIHQVSRAYSFKVQCENNEQILLKKAEYTSQKLLDLPCSTQNQPLKNNDSIKIEYINKEEVKPSEITNLETRSKNMQQNLPQRKDVVHKPPVMRSTLKSIMSSRSLYKCNMCNRMFNSIFRVKWHQKLEHVTAPQKCELCEKVFRTEEQMKRHINIHNTGKPQQCDECGKAFAQKADLVAHIYSHTGERPFLCTQCGKSFKRNSELIIHMRTHTNLRPYHCKICGNTYRTSSSFAIHKRSHSGERPFACTYCDKKFRSTACLKSHTLIHTGEKPYTCEYCGRGFIKSYTLTVHKRIHTCERPHVCKVCGKDFIQAVCLRTHMKSHEIVDNTSQN